MPSIGPLQTGGPLGMNHLRFVGIPAAFVVDCEPRGLVLKPLVLVPTEPSLAPLPV